MSQLLAQKRAVGRTLFDLTESNPTRTQLPYDPPGLLAALSDSRALTYEPSPRGRLATRQAVSQYYRDSGVEVPESRILLTASTSEAYSYLFQLLADPGDEILSPRPSYPLFEFLAGLTSVNIRQYPLRYDGGWHFDFIALEQSISPRTRAIVVVNPNNPTGSFLKRDELEQLESLALRHDVAILSDEVFCDYSFEERASDERASAGRVPTLVGHRRARTFSMSGLSKVAGLPQMKLGWIAASGPAADQSLDALELIADTYLSVASPVQVALPELLRLSVPVREAIQHRVRRNLSGLTSAMAGSRASLLHAEGGWYATLQVPRVQSEEQWAMQLLSDLDVVVQPGFFFDFEAEAYLVLSLLTEPDVFREGIRRLRTLL